MHGLNQILYILGNCVKLVRVYFGQNILTGPDDTLIETSLYSIQH